MFFLSKTWFEILSELFVNLSAGWFGVVLIEPQFFPVKDIGDIFILTFKSVLGILSLVAAKQLKEEAKKL